MSESNSEVVEIQEIATEDMSIILRYIYGTLDAIPEERLHPLILAADRLQAWCPTSLFIFDQAVTTLRIGAAKLLLCMGPYQQAHRKDET